MPISLAQSQIINKLADALYPFLPGKPHPYADARISFRGVAKDIGVGHYWVDGSKLPAITELLTKSFEADKGTFATLVREVIRRGLIYREVKDPVTREDMDGVNELLLKLGLRIKDLVDAAFLETLAGNPRGARSRQPVPDASPNPGPASDSVKALRFKLHELASVQPLQRGFAFEGLLNEVFHAFGLAPRGSFRLVGEQIDGSFHHAGQTYLVEAKWQTAKIGQADLLTFSGKVGGKAHWSRGAYVGLNGYSQDGLEAFARGKQTNIICIDGLDLYYVLDGQIGLRELIDMKARRAAESNEAFVSIRSLLDGAL